MMQCSLDIEKSPENVCGKVAKTNVAKPLSVGTNCYKLLESKFACMGWYLVLEHIKLQAV